MNTDFMQCNIFRLYKNNRIGIVHIREYYGAAGSFHRRFFLKRLYGRSVKGQTPVVFDVCTGLARQKSRL